MTRILHILSSLARNGTETFIMNLFKAIDRNRFHFDFLIFTEETEGYYEEAKALGAKIYRLPPRSKGPLKYLKALDSFFANHAREYDCVHLHGNSLSSIAPIHYAKRYGIPTRVFHVHSTSCEGLHNRILHNINKHLTYHEGTHFLACSKPAVEWGYRNSKAYKDAKIITNGINLEKFEYDPRRREAIRKDMGLGHSLTIIHIGSFNVIKNHSFLIKIFASITKRLPDARLILVGKGPLMNPTRELAAQMGILDKILFLGTRNDVADILQAADVAVMPSLFEGLPFTAIEAHASRLPLIASDNLPQELNILKRHHILSLSEPIEKWADMIIRIAKEPRTACRDAALMDYSIETTVSQLYNIYTTQSTEMS